MNCENILNSLLELEPHERKKKEGGGGPIPQSNSLPIGGTGETVQSASLPIEGQITGRAKMDQADSF